MFSLCCLTSSCITRGTLCFCSFIPSTITSISIPTKSMGYMTYLRLTCAAICWVMISVIITFSIFSTSSLTFCLITSLHWATVSTPAYCWWQPRSSTAPWPPGISSGSDQSQVRTSSSSLSRSLWDTFPVYLGGFKREKIFRFLRGEWISEAKKGLNLVGFKSCWPV